MELCELKFSFMRCVLAVFPTMIGLVMGCTCKMELYHTVNNMRLSTIWQLHFRMLSGRFSRMFVSGLLNHPMGCPPKGIAQHNGV
jgi:hypothetical protein